MSDSEDESKDTNLKVVLIGDGSSGKVSISVDLLLNPDESNYLNRSDRLRFRPDTPKINSRDSTIKH